MTVGWRRATVGGALALALLAAACGGSNSTTASPAAPSGLATTPIGPIGSGATGVTGSTGVIGASGASGATGASGSAAVNVTQNNFVFEPNKVTVKSGTTISVQNLNGTIPHTFTIKNTNINVVNDHGQTSQVKIDLPPGTYEFFCRFHVSLGMKGTLVVT